MGGKDTCSSNFSMVGNSYSSGNWREGVKIPVLLTVPWWGTHTPLGTGGKGGGSKDTCSPNCSMVGNSYSSGNAAAPSSCPRCKEYLVHRSILFSDIL